MGSPFSQEVMFTEDHPGNVHFPGLFSAFHRTARCTPSARWGIRLSSRPVFVLVIWPGV